MRGCVCARILHRKQQTVCFPHLMQTFKVCSVWVDTTMKGIKIVRTSLVSFPDLIQHVYRFQYYVTLKAIRGGGGFGFGTETRTSPTFAYLGRISSVVRSPSLVPRPSGGGKGLGTRLQDQALTLILVTVIFSYLLYSALEYLQMHDKMS